MTELEQQVQERLSKNDFMQYNHIELDSVERDRAVFRLTLRPGQNTNPFGMLHGGAIYTLADNAAGCCAHTDGRGYVTQTSTLHFMRNITEGTAYSTAVVRHRGRATCLVNVEVKGEDGKLLATGDFTFFCVRP